MLSKYNLYVGNECSNIVNCTPYGDEATGIQNQQMIGAPADASYPRRGTTIFSETSTKALLANKADKLVDPDLKRKYDLDLSTKGFEVYNHKEPFVTVIPLSQFGKLKGVGFYDKDFDGEYNIILDEFQLEQGERRTSFNILYNFIGMCENIARTTKSRIRVILLGNTLEEASTILKAFNFLPEKFGRFYLLNSSYFEVSI